MIVPELEASIRAELGTDIQLQTARGISGGDIHQAWLLKTNQGDFFLKTNHPKAAPLFTAEAEALAAINASQTLKCPQVLAQGQTEQQAWLLMNYIEMQSSGQDALRGQLLAKMHRQTSPQFGWAQDNYIGHSLQTNPWTDDWLEFFAKQRLAPQLDLASNNGAPAGLQQLGHTLLNQLDRFFTDYQPVASLLHGDLWAGNSAFDSQGQPLIFDPASYYGDRETDLAMTELFGGFSADFYQGYETEWPLDSGYALRKDLYNLYHILNHYNLFGGHYAHQAERIIRELLQTR